VVDGQAQDQVLLDWLVLVVVVLVMEIQEPQILVAVVEAAVVLVLDHLEVLRQVLVVQELLSFAGHKLGTFK
jgi:hypothetical protein